MSTCRAQEDDFIYQLIEGKTLPNIVASRPNASYPLRKHFTRKIEVVGFRKHQIQQYISALPTTSAAIISEYLDWHKNVALVSYLPLHLTIVTYLALHSEKISLLDLDTDTKIYHMFVNLTFWQRYKDVENLDEIHSQAFGAISKIAFDATTTSDHFESSLRWHNMNPELRTKVESFSILSINKQREGDIIHSHFTFSHYTFQEFFAAYYLITLPHEEQMIALELYKHSPRLMWRFFFGLLRVHSSENTTKLFEKFARAHIYSSIEVLLCAYELKKPSISDVLVQALEHSITIRYVRHPSDCAAIGYAISLNPHQFKRLTIGFDCSVDTQEACFASLCAKLPETNGVVQLTLGQLMILSDRTVSAMVTFLQHFPNLQQLELVDLGVHVTPSFPTTTVIREIEGLRHLRHLVNLKVRIRRSFQVKESIDEILTHLIQYLTLGDNIGTEIVKLLLLH